MLSIEQVIPTTKPTSSPNWQWACIIFFNPLAAPPYNGVITCTEVDHLLQKYWYPTIIYSLHYTNSALMFYFILFNFSIKRAKKNEALGANIYNWIYHCDIYQPPQLSLKRRVVGSFSKVILIALKQSKTELTWRIKNTATFLAYYIYI